MACFSFSSVFACRFNVREVGFVDLGDQPYGFFCYVDNSTEQYLIEGFLEITDRELHQTNIEAVIINVDTSPDHPLLAFLDSNTKTLPAFVLVSPAGQTMKIESIDKGESYRTSLQKALNNIISSSFRKEIAEKVIDSFGVILIIEGPDPEENENALKSAKTAIQYIAPQMEWLPKQVGNPPVILKMIRQQQQKEKILLWSFGIDPDNISQTYAVVLYGRGRLMGGALSKKYLTKEMLARFFYVIGADCECGLDRSLMHGGMMPSKWENEQLQKLSERLGFDTEHPMVKIEISNILRNGYRVYNNNVNLNQLLEYLEYEIPDGIFEFDNMKSSSALDDQAIQTSLKNKTIYQPSPEPSLVEEEFKLLNPFYWLGGAGIIVFGFGVYIFISVSGKKR